MTNLYRVIGFYIVPPDVSRIFAFNMRTAISAARIDHIFLGAMLGSISNVPGTPKLKLDSGPFVPPCPINHKKAFNTVTPLGNALSLVPP